MCGRFTLFASPGEITTLFDLPEEPILAPRYNVAPTQPVGLVRMDPKSEQREWALTLWGLIPSWSKDPSMGALMINARSETVTEKPAFRAAFKRRRCLVPISGFYEWQKLPKGKQPFYITARDEKPLAVAGLWEYWEGADGSALESCTLLTTAANEKLSMLHDRMPVFVAPEDFGQWLGSGRDETPQTLNQLQHLLRPYPDEALVTYPVSTFVNRAGNEGASCIEPLVEHGVG